MPRRRPHVFAYQKEIGIFDKDTLNVREESTKADSDCVGVRNGANSALLKIQK